MRYDAPEGTEVSTNVGGEEFRVSEWPIDVVDEPIAAVLQRLADDERNPIHRVTKKGD